MKKFLILLLLASPVQADMRHSITTSAKIQLDAAYSSAERIGTTYSVTGNNITPSTTVGGTTTSGAIGGLTVLQLLPSFVVASHLIVAFLLLSKFQIRQK